jgi:hypothetical protein
MEEKKWQGQQETSIETLRGHTMFGQPRKCVGGHNSSRKRKGQPQVKELEDNVIASLDSYRRKGLNKKQRRSEERGRA